MIRDGAISDIPQLIEFGRAYFENEGRTPNLDTLANFYMQHFIDDNAACFVSTERGNPMVLNGFICCMAGNHHLHGEPCAFMTKWYAKPGAGGHGARLFRHFEKWVASKGMKRVYATGRQERTLSFLVKKGYEPVELMFTKVFS